MGNTINSSDTQVSEMSDLDISQIPMPASYISEMATSGFITVNKNNLKNSRACYIALLAEVNRAIRDENAYRDKKEALPLYKELPLLCIAMLIAARDDVALITSGDRSGQNKVPRLSTDKKMNLPIAIYNESGINEGVWEITMSYENSFGMLVESYKPTASKKDKQEIFILIKSKLRVITTCQIPYYTAFENGIWDDLNKKLIPFSKDLVFTSKCHTNLNVNAQNPFIYIPEDGSTWDVLSWLSGLGDDEMILLIKEVIAAAMLPNTRFDKMVLFYAEDGCNAKGTICELIRQILGEETIANIPLSEFGKPFGLSKLPGANAIISDENKVEKYSNGVAELKAIITGDMVTVNQKYMPSFDFRFCGLVIECINEMKSLHDKTKSFLRRLHFVPFSNTFVNNPKKYIKSRLIHMDEVKEFIVKLVMVDMPYFDSFTETEATLAALDEYIAADSPVAEYLHEILPVAKWDLLPAQDFLYEGFKTWSKKNSSEKVYGRNTFISEVKQCVENDSKLSSEWEWTDSCRPQGYIDPNIYEPLIKELYLLKFMMMGNTIGSPYTYYLDMNSLNTHYSGLKRRTSSASGAANNAPIIDDDTEEESSTN